MNSAFLSVRTAGSGSSDELQQFFRQQGALKDFAPQTELYRQGEAIRDICLIKDGLVKLNYTNEQGREMLVSLRSSGCLLGAATISSGNPALATAVTLQVSQIYCLSAAVFSTHLQTDGDFARQVVRTVSRNAYEQMLRQAQLGLHTAPVRLAQYLLQEIAEAAPQESGEIHLQLPLNDLDLAGWLAIRPEYLSRVLREWKEKGIIRRDKGELYISSVELLRQAAR